MYLSKSQAGIVGYGAVRRLFNALPWVAFALITAIWAGSVGAAAPTLRIVALGDSLTAGYGLPAEASFPAQLERALRARGHAVEVVNAGVSGDTTAGGLARLDWVLADAPDAVIVALGANDGLRGIDPADTRANLEAILRRLAERDVPVLLAGMYAPPNLGREYGVRFNAVYPELAEKYDTLLYPFLLDGVVMDPALNQADGIHPNSEGVAVMVRNILPLVEELIARAAD